MTIFAVPEVEHPRLCQVEQELGERIRELIEITDQLYRSLTPRQRRRADRLFRPLGTKLGCEAAPARSSHR